MERTDSEVLAELLGITTERAAQALTNAGGWDKLLSPDACLAGTGLSLKKRRVLALIREVEKRHLTANILNKSVIKDPESVVAYLKGTLQDRLKEVFQVLFLNKANAVVSSVEMFKGTVDETTIHPREIAREALERGATAVVFAHNHPSGRTEPSREDISITQKLKTLLEVLDIRVLDHIIIGAGAYYSFREQGLV